MPRILIIAGEASGDLHGANLARAIYALKPGTTILGVGGGRMAAVGVTLLEGIRHIDVMGLVGPSLLGAIVQRVRAVRRVLETEAFDAVVLIDNPGLNLHFARVAKRAGHRVVYYVAPQLWAWRPGRMRWMQRRVDHVIVILPFERDLYRRAGVPCTFVGHPLLDEVKPSYDRAELRKAFMLDAAVPVIGFLPGSRAGEVRALLPVMLETAARLEHLYPGIQFVLAQASTISDELLGEVTAGSRVKVRMVKDQASEVMAAADVVLVASGTATLQTAIVGTPMILMYSTNWPTYWLARSLIRVKWIGLVNLVAGRSLVPEIIQQDVTPERLTEEAAHLLRDRAASRQMREGLRAVRDALGEPGASQRAAAVVLAVCRT